MHPWFLGALEVTTGAGAIVGGALLVARPDGGLLRATVRSLSKSPFTDWRVPGLLLAVLVGGGGLASGWCALRDTRAARAMSLVFGTGLLVFELTEVAWIGFQPLEAVFGAVGVGIVLAAWDCNDPNVGFGERAS